MFWIIVTLLAVLHLLLAYRAEKRLILKRNIRRNIQFVCQPMEESHKRRESCGL